MKHAMLMFCLLFIAGCVVKDKRISVVNCEGVLSSGVLQREYVVNLNRKMETKSGAVYKVTSPKISGVWLSPDAFIKLRCMK
ncbi:hypothetical protein C3U89_003938 [Escherichia coli]|nr:hypothetical protein [Escherichia coli]EFC3824959.1 hypothetical protein [Escherichia coli]EFC7484118.1 hypothetical protein [Escherichia coli]EFC8033030.1 hypothetical protein [Escherichia coli]EFC8383290.1 hypothetical protein [Escherichia coli]